MSDVSVPNAYETMNGVVKDVWERVEDGGVVLSTHEVSVTDGDCAKFYMNARTDVDMKNRVDVHYYYIDLSFTYIGPDPTRFHTELHKHQADGAPLFVHGDWGVWRLDQAMIDVETNQTVDDEVIVRVNGSWHEVSLDRWQHDGRGAIES